MTYLGQTCRELSVENVLLRQRLATAEAQIAQLEAEHVERDLLDGWCARALLERAEAAGE